MKKQGRITKAVTKSLWSYNKATVYSIDGDRVNLQIGGMPNLLKHVEVSGEAGMLTPGQEVAITWRDNRPVVVSGAGNAGYVIPPHDHLSDSAGGLLTGYTPSTDCPAGASLLFSGAKSNYAVGSTVNGTQIMGIWWEHDANTYQDAWWELSCYLAPGAYTLTVTGVKYSGHGKTDVYVDGVSVAAGWDWYASAYTYNHAKSCAITIDRPGLHRFRLASNGKNASSSGYKLRFTLLELQPAA